MLQDKNNLSNNNTNNNLVDATIGHENSDNTSLIDTSNIILDSTSASDDNNSNVVSSSPVNEWDTTISLKEIRENEALASSNDEKDDSKFGNIRYNPVTGEDMDINQVKDEVNNDEKLKKVEVEYKPASKGSTILLVLFFIFLLGFIIFLPDIVSIIDAYKAGRGNVVLEEIPTGKLVCTLDTNTINLDKSIERVFYYEELKLKTSKFSTTIRGDATLDEEALQELYNQCSQIKENVDGFAGINISCDLTSDTLTEKESFDYEKYDASEISTAYSEAGGSLVEFKYDQDIDRIMYLMKQGGFKCNKEK